MMRLYIVGKVTGDEAGWEFQGVFDNSESAMAACKDARYFVGPADLNVQIPDDRSEWPEAWYPLQK